MMDNEHERNEHFKGFADLLFTEICKLPGVYIETDRPEQEKAIPRLIAERAYDLVQHATEHINKNAIYTEHPRFDAFMLAIVPDLTEWPDLTD